MGVAHQPFGIGIEQQLVMIEAVAAFGLVGAGNPVAIDLTGHHFRQSSIFSALAEKIAIGAAPVPCRAERKGRAYTLSDQGHLSCHLFPLREFRDADRGGAVCRCAVSWPCRMGAEADASRQDRTADNARCRQCRAAGLEQCLHRLELCRLDNRRHRHFHDFAFGLALPCLPESGVEPVPGKRCESAPCGRRQFPSVPRPAYERLPR